MSSTPFFNKYRLTMILLVFLSILSISGCFAKTAPHIVGGRDADKGEWPWQLALYSNNLFSCGASILGSTWGVTAGHCVEEPSKGYSIMAGSNAVNSTCKPGVCHKRTLTNVTLHPDYSPDSSSGFPNDLAVISWKEPIPESTGNVNVKYATRATTTDQLGKNCFITGWGRLRGFGPLPTWLQEAEIDVLTRKECAQKWDENSITDKQVCVTDKKNQTKGACNGDSGGPLVCEVAPNKWELVGATSWGSFSCSTTLPSVYTRISSYNSWIDSVKPKEAEEVADFI